MNGDQGNVKKPLSCELSVPWQSVSFWSEMKLVTKETHHLQAGRWLSLIYPFIHVTWAAPITVAWLYYELECTLQLLARGSSFIIVPLSLHHIDSYHKRVSPLLSMLVPTVLSYVSSSLGDNETTETIFLLPLAGKLHGDALWLGMPSMHSRPIRLTVSKRLKHVRLFKSNQRLKRLFRCIFHSVKNKKRGEKVYEWTNVQIQTDLIGV